MTYTFKLSRRIARLRAPVFAALVVALAACDGDNSLAPAEGTDPGLAGTIPAEVPSSAVTFAGGIPFGTAAQPNEAFGSRFNGALRNIHPQYLTRDLAEIKARGGKVALMMAGPEFLYKDADGHFSLTKWKARIDRYKDVNFNAYINDGTLIGHYLIDEPNDPANWNGRPIPGTALDEMARYSKSRWPNLPTIVRTYPDYLETWAPYRYVDAAWAQYVQRKGDPAAFLADNVASARRQGLSLIVGLNLIKGTTSKTELSASQVKSWGSALMGSSYPCAFISWHYDAAYLSTTAMKDAMDYLRNQAERHGSKSCAASAAGSTPPPPSPPPPPPAPPPAPSVEQPLPFGLYQSPLDEYGAGWTGSMYRGDPSRLVRQLDRARSAKMKVVVSLTSSARSKNTDGTFSLTKWKAQVDQYRSLALARYISDKTMYAHYLVERPECASCWGGRAISWTMVEEMARYSKTVWPGLATTVRAAPTALAQASFRWTYLDAGWAQYNTRRGDARTFAATEAAAAKAEGLGLMIGVSLLDASGNGVPMTASQIKQIGTALAKGASVCALVGWKHDAAYLGQTGIRQALDSVARVAKSRTAPSCVVN